MTEAQAITTLCRERYRAARLAIPRYTPPGWWQCDLFELTRAGYFREYEVKLTRSDFKADRDKVQENRRAGTVRNKHATMGQPCGPVQFWYVVPAGLVTAGECPAWAGLIYLMDRPGAHVWRWYEQEQRAAPRLHGHKAAVDIDTHARSVCYYRMHDLLFRRFKAGK